MELATAGCSKDWLNGMGCRRPIMFLCFADSKLSMVLSVSERGGTTLCCGFL